MKKLSLLVFLFAVSLPAACGYRVELCISGPAGSVEYNKLNFDKFTERYKAPDGLSKMLPYFIDQQGSLVDKPIWVSADNVFYHCKKQAFERIILAERARVLVEKLGLNKIKIPKKYVVYVDQKNGWNVYSKGVEIYNPGDHLEHGKEITKEELQELITFIEETGFCDWGCRSRDWFHRGNMLRGVADNCFYCIDTEPKTFSWSTSKEECVLYALKYFQLYGLQLSKEAQIWLLNHIANYRSIPKQFIAVALFLYKTRFSLSMTKWYSYCCILLSNTGKEYRTPVVSLNGRTDLDPQDIKLGAAYAHYLQMHAVASVK
jgi:hypothetical protein